MSDKPDDLDIPDRAEPEDDILDENQADLPVKLRDAGGTVREYTIREMGPKTLQKWFQTSAQRFQRKGKAIDVSKANYEGLHEDLITLCLFDKDGNRVPYNTIVGWGTATKLRLFVKCRKHNALDADAEDREGKG